MRFVPGLAIAASLVAAVPAMAQQAAPYAAPVGPWSFGQFYMRGDAGGAFSAGADLKSTEPFASDSLLGPGERLNGNTGNSDIFDVGLGARLLPYLRWDATMSYLPSMKFSGSGNAAHMNSWVGMVNGYIDLNGLMPLPFGPFQPYVDAGLGAASNTVDTLDTSLGGGTAINGNTRTSFAYGLGAGVGYPVAPNVTLDVAYRYLDLGEAETGASDTAGAVAPLKTDLREHTVTMGLRYMF
jgi:opacity protein-like surface antigen